MSGAGESHIGVIGLGALGTPVATRLHDAGFRLKVYDADQARANQFAASVGAEAARNLAGFAETDVIVCMLPNSTIVDSVMLGEDGLFGIIPRGSLVVDVGSSDPRHTKELAAVARSAGIDFVDAPVSGGVARAQTGQLTVMFGGTDAQLERARPLLDALASSVVQVGDVGAGHAMKAINNLLSAIGFASAMEVLEVGRRFGLDPQTMLDVLNSSTGGNNATQTKIGQQVLSGAFGSGFALRLMLKDMTTAFELGQELGVELPIAEVGLRRWREASAALPGDADQTQFASLVYGIDGQRGTDGQRDVDEQRV
jgi:3-hydroxyisobutyrate dehydrogenase